MGAFVDACMEMHTATRCIPRPTIIVRIGMHAEDVGERAELNPPNIDLWFIIIVMCCAVRVHIRLKSLDSAANGVSN